MKSGVYTDTSGTERAQSGKAVSLQREYLGLLLRILMIAVICWLMFTQVFLLTQASGNGMFPAIKDGDLIIAFRLQGQLENGDVVVYRAEGQRRIGRIVAGGTDVVALDDSGTLSVNGTVQSGEILYPSYAGEGITYPYTVPEENLFIMGDYRTHTEDSRDYGPIPREEVEAKVITILRRRGI